MYFALSFLMLVFYPILAMAVLSGLGSIFISQNHTDGKSQALLKRLATGVAVVILFGYFLARLQISSSFFGPLSALLALVFNFKRIYKILNQRLFSRLCSEIFIFLPIYLVALSTVIVPYVRLALIGNLLPSFSRGNNDLGTYVLESEALLRNGFQSTGFLINSNIADYASKNDFGFPSLMSWAASFPTVSSWTVTTPLIVVLVFMISLAIKYIVALMFPDLDVPSAIIAVISVCNAPMLYLISHHFFAQLLSMSLVFTIYAFVLDQSIVSKERFQNPFVLAIIVAAAFYTYPHMTVLVMISLLGVITISKIRLTGLRANLFSTVNIRNVLRIFTATLFALSICVPFIGNALLRSISVATDPMGWPMPRPPSILSLIYVADFSSSYLGQHETASIFILLFLFLIAGMISIIVNRIESKKTVFAMVIIVPLLLWLSCGFAFGFEAYKTWKMLFYFSPLFLTCGTLSLFSIQIKRFNRGVIYFVAGVLCVSIIPTWQPVVGGQLDPRITTSQDLYSLANNDLLRSLKTINIQLSPYLESMLAAAIVPTKFRSISSESYFPIHTELGTCTLIRLDNPIVEEYKSSVTYLNGTYGLIPLPTKCE